MCALQQIFFSVSLLSLSLGWVLSCIPGSGLVEPRRVDVRAFDWRITLHSWWRWELTHRHCQVWILPHHQPQYLVSPPLWSLYNTYHICLTHRRRISKKDPPFPKDMGPLAKDLIQRLLIKDPKTRLGSGPNGAENVKKHPFYQVDLIAYCEDFTVFKKLHSRVGCNLYIMGPL